MKISEKFVGKSQWAIFFIGLISFSLIIITLLSFVLSLFLSMALGLLLFVLISAHALIMGYTFFYRNYPYCKDIEARPFYAIPEKHAALVEVHGVYPEKPLHAGFYFVFPFLKIVTFSHVIFLGDFSGIIFDGDPKNKVDFNNSISTPIKASYIAHLYSGPELGVNLAAIDEDTASILSSLLSREKAEVRSMGLVTREIKNQILDGSIKRYARESKADDNIQEMLMSLLRLTLGSMSSDEARKDRIGLDKLKDEDSCVFNSIIKHYGVDIRSVNISDIELSEQEIEINRTIYESKTKVEVAKNKKEVAKIDAEAEADSMAIVAKALENKIRLISAIPGMTAKDVLEYLMKMEQWKSMKSTDKSFIIENGGSIAGILAALKTIS